MPELNQESINAALRVLEEACGDNPFVYAMCEQGNPEEDRLHMFSNMNPEGVAALIRVCDARCKQMVKEKLQ